jgi:hypothetical protein
MLQTTVRRAYTSGFAGQLIEDGPRRARPARIAGDDPLSRNHISRAFGWTGEIPVAGSAADGTAYEAIVTVGGENFFGILGSPQSYALYGDALGNSLGASLNLPDGSVGEFFDMATGIVVEIFNETNAAISNHYGDRIAYATVLDAAVGVPMGGLICLPNDASAAPAGYAVIPNAKLVRPFDMIASPPNTPVMALAVIQLTQ